MKYFTTTLAVSGMLVIGGCDTDNRQAETDSDYTQEVEAAENEIGQPAREDVRQDIDAETYDEEQEANQPTTTRAQDNQEASQENQSAQSGTQYDQMSNRNSRTASPGAQQINDMDGHLQEHQEANKEAAQTLTDRELEEGEAVGIYEGETTADEQQNANTGMTNDRATGQNQQTYQQNNNATQQNNRLDQNDDANIGRQGTDINQDQQNQQGTMQDDQGTNQSGIPEEGRTQGTDSQVEYETDRQGTTEMEIDNQNQQGFDNDRQGTTNMQQNQQGTQQQDINDQNTGIQNDQPATGQQGNNQQMGQEGEGSSMIIYERYSLVYPEDNYSDEDRQRMDDIMGEYESRREKTRGQMNPETGAYSSPEVDPQPRQGYDQLMSQIQENIDYPQDAQAAEIEGTVFVNFIVDENGNITEAKAVDDVIVPASSTRTSQPRNPTAFHENEIEDIKKEMHKEAVKAVEATSGQWEAGQQGGESVRSEMQIPVRFNIAEIGGTGTDDR